jgi:hypothetical protein
MVVIMVTILTVIGHRSRSEVTISIVPDRTSRSEAPLIKSSNGREHMRRRSPEMMTRLGALCGPHTRGVLYRRPIVLGDPYIITKQHLDLSHRPDRPFQNDEAVAVPIDDRISEWHRVAVPAIRALGVQQVASRFCLNCSRRNLQRRMDPSNAPPRSMKLARVEKKIFKCAAR